MAGPQDGVAVRAAGPTAQDPRLAGQVGKGQGPPAGQRVAGRQHDQHRVLEQRVGLDQVGEGLVDRLGQQGQVGPAGPHPVEGLRGRLDQRELDLDLRVVGPEGGHGGRQQRGGRAGEGGQPDPAAPQPGEGRQLGVGGVQLGQDRVGPADQGLAGLGQADAAGVALDQPGPGLALQGGDLLGDGRLAVGERLGGGRERAPQRDLAEHSEAAHVQHKHHLSMSL